MTHCCVIDLADVGDRVPGRCMCDLQFCCIRGLVTLARKRERAWRVTRKLGSLVILAERERVPGESLESI